MNFNCIIKTGLVAVAAMVSLSSFSQDLIARQAPIDKKLKTVDSLALQKQIRAEQSEYPALSLYPNWNNQYVHAYGNAIIPETYTIDLTGFHMPTPSTKITSPFGPRWRRMHNGLDLKVNIGDTIVAAFDGKVRIVKYERRGYGKYVVIRHDNGLETVYGHLSKQLVEENQLVKAGEVIGLGGNTGRSTGSHLHFETRFLGIAINPIYMFDFPKQDIVADTYTFRKTQGVKRAGSHDTQAADGTIRYHKVKSGDTLSRIAKLRGVSVSTLCKFLSFKFYLYQSKNRIINHVHVISVDSFGHQCVTGQTFNLLGAVNFHQNQVCIRTNAHTPPSLIIIMVLGKHQFQCRLGILIIKRHRFFITDVGRFGISQFQLNQSDNTVIDNRNEFRTDSFVYQSHSFSFNTTYPVGFDKNLIGHRSRTQDTPRRTVIVQLLGE